jgi:ribonucleoside-diphosphate reductase alpha chain
VNSERNNEVTRQRPPTTRHGKTHKIVLNGVTMYLTVNEADGKPVEMFCKASDGWQGWVDTLCVTASLALQYGAPISDIIKHWSHQAFPPAAVGQGKSIPDALARVLQQQYPEQEIP